jgi:hypothetical protein
VYALIMYLTVQLPVSVIIMPKTIIGSWEYLRTKKLCGLASALVAEKERIS